MDDHLAKPIEAAELVRVLVDVVEDNSGRLVGRSLAS